MKGVMKMKKSKVSKSVKMKKLLVCCFLVFVVMSLMSVAAFAGSGASTGTVTNPNTSFDNIIKFIAGWISKLGLVVGFIGAVQLGFAFKNDDADGKTKGLRTLISGFIVFALCSSTSLQMFGIV